MLFYLDAAPKAASSLWLDLLWLELGVIWRKAEYLHAGQRGLVTDEVDDGDEYCHQAGYFTDGGEDNASCLCKGFSTVGSSGLRLLAK